MTSARFQCSNKSLLGVAMAAALMVVAACGIGADSSPRALPVITSTSTTAVPVTDGDEPSSIYFVQAESLVPLTRDLSELSPRAVMESLLAPPTLTEGSGLSSSVPAATELRGIEVDEGTLKVDLSEDFLDVEGLPRIQAIGQIVMSQSLLGGIDRVAFSVEGERLQVQTPERGDQGVVTACDYAGLLAEPDGEDTVLSESENIALSDLRDRLELDC